MFPSCPFPQNFFLLCSSSVVFWFISKPISAITPMHSICGQINLFNTILTISSLYTKLSLISHAQDSLSTCPFLASLFLWRIISHTEVLTPFFCALSTWPNRVFKFIRPSNLSLFMNGNSLWMGKQCPLVALILLHLQNAVLGVPGVAVRSFQVPYCYWEDKFSLHQFRSRGVGEELESYLTTD